ncbi:hypothetical protein BDN71DRAFT_1440392 [Pleurotus eryngii]|uniref:Assembly factor cbp4 n=1 Tax=Pleurotus eryngii TaxID=5323 RepID=A0A9P6DK79_PLEER|nr:hypothetical protein BDN71DRAFT_1440392 [Pleurotus eryngii]
MASFPLARFTVAAAGLMGFGYILMRATVPTEDQLYNEMAPDIRRKVDASRAARLAREQAAARQADVQLSNPDPDAAKPIWANDRNT